ncbi:hypothetical protein Ahy_B04g071850 isoform B [Arachis hypogaea]|uniref:Uncharacterized protein n=1 Tax=Arachis hypogaea TaxID=3818 RepID=A0A444ZLR2_ARAHY|nr:hypothetical protein Ahy_B04g071850 isoform B [Arachis hypogaea]
MSAANVVFSILKGNIVLLRLENQHLLHPNLREAKVAQVGRRLPPASQNRRGLKERKTVRDKDARSRERGRGMRLQR